jgi:raffinose/stachyose/melibiose transport system substrate-binding protein
MNSRTMRKYAAVGAVAALSIGALSACGSDGGGSADGTTTLTFWHNGTADPILTIWQDAADAYEKENPDITIDVVPVQNEDLETKIPLALSSDNPPDIFLTRGGGQLATQVQSGQVADITELTSGWIDDLGVSAANWEVEGAQYGVPYASQVVGFWYRTDLFAQAGITETPTTMDDLHAAVDKLKAAGIAPIAVGGKDRWPDAFYYNTFAVRECSEDVLKKGLSEADLTDDCFTKAGQDVIDFIATEPFQEGFNGTPAQQGSGSSAGLVANGQAAMELQGTWDKSVMQGLTETDLDPLLGWFPFPSVEGGEGDPSATLGGGDGFACTQEHAEECVDFLEYLSSDDIQSKLVESEVVAIPVKEAAAATIGDPVIKSIYDFNADAAYVTTYFDVALPTGAGAALNDAVANLFSGQGTADSVAEAVEAAK